MRRTIWPFVIWLLAIALPMQSVAAATMAHCAPAPVETNSAAGHDHAVGSAAHHHHEDAADTAASDAEYGAADTALADASSLHKCSACAACCVGLGLPSTVFTLPWPPVADSAPSDPSAHDVAFFTSGPERPPRLQLR